MELTNLSRRSLLAVVLLFATLFLAACGGINPNFPLGTMDPVSDASGAALRIGDELDVAFISPPPPFNVVIVDTIKEDGSITLIHGEKFQAAGKTVNQLRQDVTRLYTSNYYRSIDFTINTPKRSFSVGGEVKSGGSFLYPNTRVGLVEAINLAGGLTDFAAQKRIQVTRWTGGKPITVNFDQANEDSRKNLEIYPGDTIRVPRRLF